MLVVIMRKVTRGCPSTLRAWSLIMLVQRIVLMPSRCPLMIHVAWWANPTAEHASCSTTVIRLSKRRCQATTIFWLASTHTFLQAAIYAICLLQFFVWAKESRRLNNVRILLLHLLLILLLIILHVWDQFDFKEWVILLCCSGATLCTLYNVRWVLKRGDIVMGPCGGRQQACWASTYVVDEGILRFLALRSVAARLLRLDLLNLVPSRSHRHWSWRTTLLDYSWSRRVFD